MIFLGAVINKSRVVILIAAVLGCPLAVLADDTYQFGADFGATRSTSDVLPKSERAGATISHFFQPVPLEPRDNPLDETPFVARAGSIAVQYTRMARDDTETVSYGTGSIAGIDLVLRQSVSPLYLRASFSSYDSGRQRAIAPPLLPAFESRSKTNTYEMALGAYVARTTLLAAEIGKAKSKYSDSWAMPSAESEQTSFGLNGRHLGRIPGDMDIALDARLEQTRIESPLSSSEFKINFFGLDAAV